MPAARFLVGTWSAVGVLVAAALLGSFASARAELPERRQASAAVMKPFEDGAYAEAEAAIDRELAACKAAPRSADDCLDLLLGAANVALQAGHAAKAEGHAREALKIALAVVGERNATTAEAYSELASSLKAQGRLRDAETLIRKDLEISRAVLGEAHADTGISYNNLATNLDAQGRYAEAELNHRRAMAIWSASPDGKEYLGAAHDNLAKNLDNQGRYEEGEAEYLVALKIRREAAPDHPSTATTLSNLATNYDARGRFADGERLLREALDIRERKLGPDHPEVAIGLGNLARNLGEQGREAEAEIIARRGLQIEIATLGADHIDTGISLSNLAVGIERQGRLVEATPMFRSALAILTKRLGKDHPDTLSVSVRLARNLLLQGRRREPEILLRQAVMRGCALGEAQPDYARFRIELARFLMAHGDLPGARKLLEAGIPRLAASIGEDHPEVIQSRASLADALRRQGRLAEAHRLFGVAGSAAVARLSGHGGNSIAQRRAISEFATLFQADIGVLWQLSHARAAALADGCDRFCESAFADAQWAINSSAAYAIDQVAVRAARGSGPIAALERERDGLLYARDAGDRRYLVLTDGDRTERQALLAARATGSTRLAAIDREIAALDPAYADLARPRAVSVGEVQAALHVDEVLLVSVPTSDAGYVWAMTRDRIRWARRPGLSAAITAATVARLRAGLSAGGEEGRGQSGRVVAGVFDRARAAGLYHDLIAPVEPLLAGKRILLSVTTGTLASLPLGLLPTAADEMAPWLIDRVALATLPSPASLLRMRCVGCAALPATGNATIAFVGIGAPDLAVAMAGSSTRSSDWFGRLPPLPFAARELQGIGAHFGGHALVLTGAGATEARARRDPAVEAARFIAFATHGLRTSEPRFLGEPALVFTPPATITGEDDDGLLTVSEAAQMHLGADLVALSACDTAAADGTFNGDDLSGFARAFFSAGVRALLVSHWPVNDEATAQLMIATFDGLDSGNPGARAIALQTAMLRLRDTPGKRWAHPRYWAAFVLVGDPG